MNYRNKYEDRNSSKSIKVIAILFIIAVALTAFSKLYLEEMNKKLKTEVSDLKNQKNSLSGEVDTLEKRYKEVEVNYNDLMNKLNQNKK